MKVTMEPYGQLPDGGQVYLYSMENNSGMKVEVINYGAAITAIYVPDRNGKVADIALGRDTLEGYRHNDGYLGEAVGRCGNRISGAQVTISGKSYALDKNDGEHSLHGGAKGLTNRLFLGELRTVANAPALLLSTTIEDMSDGYPGTLTVNIAYALTDDNALMIDYRAVSDQSTVINLTNHTYFNLAGHDSGTIHDHVLQLDCPLYMVHKADGIPTGALAPVEGTPFDFRTGARVGDGMKSDVEQITQFGGYDHNLVLNGAGYRRVGCLSEPTSGRQMEIHTDLPGIQLYTGNMLAPGTYKNGARYEKHQGLCLETQLFPDAVHMSWLASPYYAAGEEYTSTTTYKFSAE